MDVILCVLSVENIKVEKYIYNMEEIFSRNVLFWGKEFQNTLKNKNIFLFGCFIEVLSENLLITIIYTLRKKGKRFNR